ncbi:hypothetical protein LUZ60_012092 [Juncus effusus]|nr:hypothetical protein LUZ60_012092 [Juncus effusus]
MVKGTLEVLLVNAKGLQDGDVLGKMDPYAILSCRSVRMCHEQKSSVKTGAGSEPEWNESFVFKITDDVTELHIKLMDSDTFTADDCVGEAKILLEPVFMEGKIPPTVYNVVKDREYHGQIKVSLTFIPDSPYHESPHKPPHKESFGGWKESATDY